MDNLIVSMRDGQICQGEIRVLEGVHLSLYRGEFTYLIGKTGSGKSSLLKTLYGALPLTIGTARVAGFDLRSLDRKNIPLLRRKLGMVFQDFNLLNDRTIRENLRFVLLATDWKDNKKINHRIDEVLKQVHLSKAIEKMPHELSGGEQQRVAIARALLNTPDLLIADEPTGNLDPETSGEIIRLMRKLSVEYNTAVLLASHDKLVMDAFPARVLACKDKKVVEISN